jgi:hypothetical protein
MTKCSLLAAVSVLAGCATLPAAYSRRDIVAAVQIVSAQRGDPSNWAATLQIPDRSYSAAEAGAAVRSALRDRWCRAGGGQRSPVTVPLPVPSTARENANAAQLAASTPDIRC